MIFGGTTLTGDALEGLDKFEAAIKQQVIRAGASRMSQVIKDEVHLNASRLRKTENRAGRKPGTLANAVYRVYSPEKSDSDTKTYRVSWNKKEAPHGHLLENGTSKAPAYPFVRPAVAKFSEAVREGKARMRERLKELTK